jgi:hypothetical protein
MSAVMVPPRGPLQSDKTGLDVGCPQVVMSSSMTTASWTSPSATCHYWTQTVQNFEDGLHKSNGKHVLNHFSLFSSMILLSVLAVPMNSVVDSKCLIMCCEK